MIFSSLCAGSSGEGSSHAQSTTTKSDIAEHLVSITELPPEEEEGEEKEGEGGGKEEEKGREGAGESEGEGRRSQLRLQASISELNSDSEASEVEGGGDDGASRTGWGPGFTGDKRRGSTGPGEGGNRPAKRAKSTSS